MTVFKTALTLIAMPVLMMPLSAQANMSIEGLWAVESGDAHITVKDCGDATPCGTLAWFDEAKAEATTDELNPDPELKGQPLLGSRVFWGFKPKKGKWSSGKIYDAESGKTYKSKLELAKDGTLKVKGCIGPICQTQVWTRVK